MTDPNMPTQSGKCNTSRVIPRQFLPTNGSSDKSRSAIAELIQNHEDIWEKLDVLFVEMDRIECTQDRPEYSFLLASEIQPSVPGVSPNQIIDTERAIHSLIGRQISALTSKHERSADESTLLSRLSGARDFARKELAKRQAPMDAWEKATGWDKLDYHAKALGRSAHGIRMAIIHMPCRTTNEFRMKAEYVLKLECEYSLCTISDYATEIVRSMANTGVATQ